MNAEIYFVRHEDGSWEFEAKGVSKDEVLMVDIIISGEMGAVIQAVKELKGRMCAEKEQRVKPPIDLKLLKGAQEQIKQPTEKGAENESISETDS